MAWLAGPDLFVEHTTTFGNPHSISNRSPSHRSKCQRLSPKNAARAQVLALRLGWFDGIEATRDRIGSSEAKLMMMMMTDFHGPGRFSSFFEKKKRRDNRTT